MTDKGRDEDFIFPKYLDASSPLEYSSNPTLTPGSNQLATMNSIAPSFEPVTDFVDFTTAEPGSPSIGDRYINTVTGTSSGTTQSVTANYIYEWNGTDWTESIPAGGNRVYVINLTTFYIYTGSAWVVDNTSLAQLQFVAGAKAGNDSNSGSNLEDPVLTLSQMMTTATAKTPGSTNQIGVFLPDGGSYDTTTTVTVPSYVHISGQAANLWETAGTFVLSDYSSAVFNEGDKANTGYLFQKTSGSGNAYATFLGDINVGSAQLLNLASGNLFFNFKNARTTGGDGPITCQVLGGRLYATGDYLENTSGSANNLYAEGTGKIYADIKRIEGSGNYWLYLDDSAYAAVRALEATGEISKNGSSTHDIDILKDSSGDRIIHQDSGHVRLTAGTNKNIIANRVLCTGAMAGLGGGKGFVVSYYSSSAVSISPGWIEANGKLYILSGATEHTVTSLASAYDHHYIYIDDSGSTPPAAVFVDSTTAPYWSDAKQGWYNGDDRCIGSVTSGVSTTTIYPFDTMEISGNTIKYTQKGRSSMPWLANSQTPTGAWASPNTNESSVVVPVMATAIDIMIQDSDTGSNAGVNVVSSEFAALDSNPTNAPNRASAYQHITAKREVILGGSRNIKIMGDSGDDASSLFAWCAGYTIYR